MTHEQRLGNPSEFETPLKQASPWMWVEGGPATRLDSTGSALAEVSKPLDNEWSGWVLLYGANRVLRGDSAEDVMGRIDAILEGAGWTLAPGGPPAPKKPITADRVVAALMKDPKLAKEVLELLGTQFPEEKPVLRAPVIIATNQTNRQVEFADLGLVVPALGSVTLTDFAFPHEILSAPSVDAATKDGRIVLTHK